MVKAWASWNFHPYVYYYCVCVCVAYGLPTLCNMAPGQYLLHLRVICGCDKTMINSVLVIGIIVLDRCCHWGAFAVTNVETVIIEGKCRGEFICNSYKYISTWWLVFRWQISNARDNDEFEISIVESSVVCSLSLRDETDFQSCPTWY